MDVSTSRQASPKQYLSFVLLVRVYVQMHLTIEENLERTCVVVYLNALRDER